MKKKSFQVKMKEKINTYHSKNEIKYKNVTKIKIHQNIYEGGKINKQKLIKMKIRVNIRVKKYVNKT